LAVSYKERFVYLQGFGNYHQTEAQEGALPKNQNSPQHTHFGLYAEQISGTAFTKPRHVNLRSWLYRMLPSVAQGAYTPYQTPLMTPYHDEQPPNPLRWTPKTNTLKVPHDFIDGLFHIAGNQLVTVFMYHCNISMTQRVFANNDGEFLFVPYHGTITLHTELGLLSVEPGWIAVIPRGIKFKVTLEDTEAHGYLCENRGTPLTLPQLGLIGANGLANPRHFEYPLAAFEDNQDKTTILCKYHNKLWQTLCDHNPLNVLAWHGNYAPYRYNLSLFNTINTVSFDHPDPSISTVLTSESQIPGVANLDFVIFPSRWLVAEHTFRPPYFHRNYMNEFMGLIDGEYDAKKEGFLPGGFSIHNSMVAHGSDLASYQQAISEDLKPKKLIDNLAFMFETDQMWHVTTTAYNHPSRDKDYVNCWRGFKASINL
jgi:homogentisate 1,2-dioxygenase